jgi:hypothetical protein
MRGLGTFRRTSASVLSDDATASSVTATPPRSHLAAPGFATPIDDQVQQQQQHHLSHRMPTPPTTSTTPHPAAAATAAQQVVVKASIAATPTGSLPPEGDGDEDLLRVTRLFTRGSPSPTIISTVGGVGPLDVAEQSLHLSARHAARRFAGRQLIAPGRPASASMGSVAGAGVGGGATAAVCASSAAATMGSSNVFGASVSVGPGGVAATPLAMLENEALARLLFAGRL